VIFLKRIELLLKEPLYQENMNLNAQEEQEARYCLHDFQHHLDVARIAYILVLENNDLNYFIKENGLSGKLAAKELIYAAGLLHDIGKWKEQQEGVDHASFGARVAREILPHAFFNTREIEIIGRAIYEHSNISTEMSFLGGAHSPGRQFVPDKQFFPVVQRVQLPQSLSQGKENGDYHQQF
jgi:Predicted HD superfamily hydrolase